MSRIALSGMLMFVFAGMALADGDAGIKAIGFVIENHAAAEAADTDAPRAFVTVLRDGKEVRAFEGDEIYPADVLKTDAATDITVAFVDQSAVRMHPETEIQLSPVLSTLGMNGSTVVQGHASVAFQHSSVEPRSMTLGSAERKAPVSTTGPAKLDIFVNKNADGTFVTTVAVLKGSATLTPSSNTSQTDLTAGGVAVMSFRTPVAGVTTSSPVTVTQGNLTKDQIKALHGSAVSETFVSTNKTGATIKSIIHESDGTTTSVSETVVAGKVSKDSSKTVDSSKKTVATWTETLTKISFSRVYVGYTIKSSGPANGGAGKATIKGPDKTTYYGTTIINPKTGVITFTTTKAAKDGSNVIYTFNPNGLNGATQTLIRIPKTGSATQTTTSFNKTTGVQTVTTQTGTVSGGVFTADSTPPVVKTTQLPINPPAAKTPDGHVIDQNNPPVSP